MRKSNFLTVLLTISLPIIFGCSGNSPDPLSGIPDENAIVIDGSYTFDIYLPNGEPVPDTLVVSLARPSTKFVFELPVASEFLIRIIDETGSTVSLFIGQADAGPVLIEIDLSGQSSGIYILNLLTGQFSVSRKILLIK